MENIFAKGTHVQVCPFVKGADWQALQHLDGEEGRVVHIAPEPTVVGGMAINVVVHMDPKRCGLGRLGFPDAALKEIR